MNKRLGVFVFYDEKGYVGEYIEFLLKSLSPQLEDLIVVCNGMLSEEGKMTFEKYTDQIIVRPNIGFDAGAYQEVIKKIYDEGIIDNYDELLLLNDTFFGPFYSFQSIFDTMKEKNTDFWGLTWCQPPYGPRHIQSYFMDFGSKIIKGRFLYDFFMGLNINPHNIWSIIVNMEMALTGYLERAGFLWQTYVKKNVERWIYYCPHELLVNDGLPILKIKTFGLLGLPDSQVVKSIEYLKEKDLYDINLIEKQIQYKFQKKLSDYQVEDGEEGDVEASQPVSTTNMEGIKRFSESLPGVYIYGTGFLGATIMQHSGCENIRGFIVSDEYYSEADYEGVKVYKLSQIEDRTLGIIVAMRPKGTEQVRDRLKAFQNVLYLWK